MVGGLMEQLVDSLSKWLSPVFSLVIGLAKKVISVFDWPSEVLGVSPEILAAGVLCILMIVMWRTMRGVVT